MECTFKVSIIGCGSVGAAAAYAMLLDGTPTHLSLIDIDKKRARGLVTDLEHALSFTEYTELNGTDEIEECSGSNVIFITAGARQKEGQTRLDLVNSNKKIFAELIPKVTKVAPDSIVVIVSNPVDVLTYEAIKLAGPKAKIFGTGTMLDTARFQFHIGEKLNLSPRSIEAFILGEHGDSSFPVYSSANVAGKSLTDFDNFGLEELEECYRVTKEAAYRIIHDLGYTCYSIGVVMKEIMKNIFEDSKTVVPLSTMIDGFYGHEDICLSLPCVLGRQGIERVIDVKLNESEQELLAKSVDVLKSYR